MEGVLDAVRVVDPSSGGENGENRRPSLEDALAAASLKKRNGLQETVLAQQLQ